MLVVSTSCARCCNLLCSLLHPLVLDFAAFCARCCSLLCSLLQPLVLAVQPFLLPYCSLFSLFCSKYKLSCSLASYSLTCLTYLLKDPSALFSCSSLPSHVLTVQPLLLSILPHLLTVQPLLLPILPQLLTFYGSRPPARFQTTSARCPAYTLLVFQPLLLQVQCLQLAHL